MRILNLTKSSNSLIFTGPVLTFIWQRLREESCALRERGLAHGTWNNRVSHLRSYSAFTTFFEVPDFPVQLGVLLRYIAFLGRGSLAYKSASNIISSIKWFANILDPKASKVFDEVLVISSLKGLKAQLSRPVRQKLPITVSHLVKFHSLVDLSDVKQLAFWCAVLIAFFGCLRLSNLVPPSLNKFDHLKQLRRDDIEFEKENVLMCFKWSKTNQNSGKVSWIPICPVADARFNIKIHLEMLFSSVKVSNSAPLFSYNKKEFHSRHTLVSMLNSCLLASGLSPEDYSWHSFRRGSAVFAFELGLADSAVQLLGDWSSSAFKNYLEFAMERKAEVSETIAYSFDQYVKRC